MKKFNKINIEISNICNLQCSFCPEVIRSKKIMTVSLFRRIIEQVAPLTEQVCFHLMGDPLVHPELEKLVEICHEHQVRIFLVTNGVLLREKQLELLLHPAFRQVNFSLHSFFDNFPDRTPDTYLAKIFEFTDEALMKRPELYINFRLWNLNDTKQNQIKNQLILQKIANHFHVDVSEEINLRTHKSLHLKDRLYIHFDSEFIWPDLQLPILGTQGTCYGLSSHFGILADGTVVPCCLDKEGHIPLGHIDSNTIHEILNNPRSQKIIEGFRKRKLVENLCQRCQYIERFNSSNEV